MNNIQRRLTADDIVKQNGRLLAPTEADGERFVSEAMLRGFYEAERKRETRRGLYRLAFGSAVIVGLCALAIWAILKVRF